MIEVLRTGYCIPFSSPPPLSWVPLPLPRYSPDSVKGKALQFTRRGSFSYREGAVELAPPSPGYYSRLFVVWKATGSWRPAIYLSHLNCFIMQTQFKMETNQSVLRAVQSSDWMVSIDLKDVYLQIPMHPNSRPFLRFVVFGNTYQFNALCFGLSTAPPVFTLVMAPVSVMLHDLGWILRYLDDWLVLASYRKEALWARDIVFNLCHQLAIIVNLTKSLLNPSQTATYLGMAIESPSLRAFPSEEGFDPSVTARRIFILQAAKHHCLAKPAGSPIVTVPSRARGSSLDAVPLTGALLPVGFQG